MSQYYSLVLRSFEVNSESQYNNVFFYKSGDDLTSTAESLWRAFVFESLIDDPGGPENDVTNTTTASLLQWIANIVSSDISFTGAYVYNLFNPNDFFDNNFAEALAGQRSENLSTTAAIPFRTSQESRLIRRGRKRFPGAPAVGYDPQSNTWEGTYRSKLGQVAAALGVAIFGSSDNSDPQLDVTFQPIVVGRVKCGDECKGYRLPLLLEMETRHYVARSWEYGDRPSTQKTRQSPVTYF